MQFAGVFGFGLEPGSNEANRLIFFSNLVQIVVELKSPLVRDFQLGVVESDDSI